MIGLEETHRGGERAMCISIQQDALTAELYVSVRDAVGFYHYDREDARMALDGGLYSVVAYVDGQVAGIGRVVGDGQRSRGITAIPRGWSRYGGAARTYHTHSRTLLQPCVHWPDGNTWQGIVLRRAWVPAPAGTGLWQRISPIR